MRGSIRKRGRTWTVVVSLGKDENGKRIRKGIQNKKGRGSLFVK
jgi:hypothetical protein